MHQFRDNWNCLPAIAGKSCLVQLGRFGDIINVLPIAAEMMKRTGIAPAFCVAQEFASILEGVSYCTPEVWDGPFNEAAPAVQAMAKRFASLRVSQVLAKDTKWQPTTPSYATDSWLRAGFLTQWGDLPLVFDQRDAGREAALVKKLGVDKGTLLVALEGKNSPVADAEAIAWWLTESLPEWKVVSLNGVRAERIYDLLGVLDAAGMLLCLDSAILHLAAASKVKTVALLADTLTPWRATRPRCNLAGSVLYSELKDLDAGLAKMIGLIRGGDGGVVRGACSVVFYEPFLKQTPWKAGYFEMPAEKGVTWLNPSIAEHGGKTWLAARRCFGLPQGASRRSDGPSKGAGPNLISLFEIDGNKKIVQQQTLNFQANYPAECYEDPRLCVLSGDLALSYCNVRGNEAVQRMAIVGTQNIGFQPVYGVNSKGPEKNWTWFQAGEAWHFVYLPWPHEVVKTRRGEPEDFWVTNESPCPWKYGPMRGGTPPVLVDDLYWTFFHSGIDGEKPRRRYYMGAYAFEARAPFAIKRLTLEPLLVGSEADGGELPVVFPGGAIWREGVWLVALGVNDRACGWIEIPHGELLKLALQMEGRS